MLESVYDTPALAPDAAAASWAAALTPTQRANYGQVGEAIRTAAKAARIPVDFALGLSFVESEWNPYAINPQSGALGLFQVMPGHRGDADARWSGANVNGWRDPAQNARVGLRILRDSGWGRAGLERTLASYGGFVGWLAGKAGAPAPDRYIAAVKRAATGVFWARRLGQL